MSFCCDPLLVLPPLLIAPWVASPHLQPPGLRPSKPLPSCLSSQVVCSAPGHQLDLLQFVFPTGSLQLESVWSHESSWLHFPHQVRQKLLVLNLVSFPVQARRISSALPLSPVPICSVFSFYSLKPRFLCHRHM